MGDGCPTPHSENKSVLPMGDQKEVASMKPKIEFQVRISLLCARIVCVVSFVYGG
jgi:hypothetical protein